MTDCEGTVWSHGQRTRLPIELSGFQPWLENCVSMGTGEFNAGGTSISTPSEGVKNNTLDYFTLLKLEVSVSLMGHLTQMRKRLSRPSQPPVHHADQSIMQ